MIIFKEISELRDAVDQLKQELDDIKENRNI